MLRVLSKKQEWWECFKLGAEDRVGIVTWRSLECFNWGAEDRAEMVMLRSPQCFEVQKTEWRWLH